MTVSKLTDEEASRRRRDEHRLELWHHLYWRKALASQCLPKNVHDDLYALYSEAAARVEDWKAKDGA